MSITPQWCFGPFRLDPDTASLWQGGELVSLSPKPFAVLACLVAQAGQVVTKDTLLDAAWPETVVSEGGLKNCILLIRQVLGETAATPQYIATVRGRGYRFIAPVAPLTHGAPSDARVVSVAPQVTEASALMIGREAELAQLHEHFRQACAGRRQVVLLTGEAGIGKTTLVDAFVSQVAPMSGVRVARGQCIEQYGTGEPYLPLLEALGRLGRETAGEHVVAILREQAPNWLLHLPSLLSAEARATLQQQMPDASRERMLRELAEAIETLTQDQPLLLILEDLHWSDVSTVEWLAYISRRRDRAGLMVLGTYRATEAMVQRHPIHTVSLELQRQHQGGELSLAYLTADGVATYLAQRFDGARLPAELSALLHRRTNGNPFFLAATVDTWVRQAWVQQQADGWRWDMPLDTAAVDIPTSIRQLIEQQLEQLPSAEHALLERASVAGGDFTAAWVAAAEEPEGEETERRCAALARHRQFIQVAGGPEGPGGAVEMRYQFIHNLYREVIYDRVPRVQRGRLHDQIGARLETSYGSQAKTIAAELASHYVQGRDGLRAVKYLRYAGENALQRSAYDEAIGHFTRGLACLQQLPETPERIQQELDLQMPLGTALMARKGAGDPDVERTYARALALNELAGETPQLFPVLWGLWRFYHARAQHRTTRELGEKLLKLGQDHHDPAWLLAAHQALGTTLYFVGEFDQAYAHLEQGLKLDASQQGDGLACRISISPAIYCLVFAAQTLWSLGYPDQALRQSHEAYARAQELMDPPSLAFAQYYVARTHLLRRETPAALQHAESTLALSREQKFAYYTALALFLRGAALAMQGQVAHGVAHMRQGLQDALATGAHLVRPLFVSLLAEGCGALGQFDTARRMLTEACTTAASEPCFYAAEMYRLRGQILLQQAVPDEDRAETYFHRAGEIARQQQAKSWELRAAISLSRLWQQQGKRREAYELLAPVYHWFTEGFDTADLQDAHALLAQLRA